MADLSLQEAKYLAGTLVTSGHPYAPDAILSTATDLMRWCKGAIVNGRLVTPAQQAEALVQEVRMEWEGWPEKGGSRMLRQLFESKYSKVTLEAPILKLADAVARKLLAPPCSLCAPGETHCEYGGTRGHKQQQAVIDAAVARTRKLVPRCPRCPEDAKHCEYGGLIGHERHDGVASLTYEQMQARAAAVYEEEQRRKGVQLKRLEGGQ